MTPLSHSVSLERNSALSSACLSVCGAGRSTLLSELDIRRMSLEKAACLFTILVTPHFNNIILASLVDVSCETVSREMAADPV